MESYIKCWKVLKQDIMGAFHNFHDQKGFNATYIALIPKKMGAEELKVLRPISLIGNFH